MKLQQEGQDPEDFEKSMALSMLVLEKELSVFIDEEYPLMKFWSQMENLEKLNKEIAKQNKKGRSKGTMR